MRDGGEAIQKKWGGAEGGGVQPSVNTIRRGGCGADLSTSEQIIV